MNKSILQLALSVAIACCSSTANAANLLDVFNQALQKDPTLQKTYFQNKSTQQQVPIQRANLLPQIDATTQYNHQTTATLPGISPDSSQINLNINQPLFNITNWLNYSAAKQQSAAAQLSDGAALQDLIIRTTQAYFAVLQAQNDWQLSQVNAYRLEEILQFTKKRFNAGLVKTVDVDTAQAAYATSLADQQNKFNAFQAKQASLQAITGEFYDRLAPLAAILPLANPQPKNLATWLALVKQHNLTVLADRAAVQADKKTVQAQRAGHYPTLGLTAGYTHSVQNSLQYAQGNTGSIGVALQLPLYQGGLVNAQTRKAAYDYQTQLSQLAYDYQNAIAQTQTGYDGIINGIKSIRADNLAIIAYQKTVKSTRIAYTAGLSNTNISDLLNAQQNLYQAQQAYANDEYRYITSLLQLKQAVGILSIKDLQTINGWLMK